MRVADNSTLRLPRETIIVTGLVATTFILAWGIARSPHNAFDDAFITYRYADNLRRGLGLVYNPGEWVLGTTTPLFSLLLGLMGFLIPSLEVTAHWIGVLGWIVAAWAAIALFWQAQWPRAGLVAALLLAVESSFLHSLGMETCFLVALMLALAWAWLGGRKGLTALLAALLLLTRQDSALWLLLLGLEVWRRERTLPWREGVATVLLVLPWFAFAWWRYGSILPNSALAKLGQNRLMPVGGQSSFWRMLWEAATAGLHPAVVLISVAALLLGIWVVVRYARGFWWLVVWTSLYIATYTWLAVASFPWYFVPPLVTIALLIALGFGWLLGDRRMGIGERGPTIRRPIVPRLIVALGVSLLVVLLLSRGFHMGAISTHRGYRAAYVPVGQWLADNTSIESSVAAIEIGVIGYLSQRPILDTMGLVSPDMARHQVGWVETLAYALNVHQPKYTVTLPDTAWDAIVDKWWFQKQYEPVTRFDEVTIYRFRESSDLLNEIPVQVNYMNGVTLTAVKVNSLTPQPDMTLEVWLNVDVQFTAPGRYLFTLYLVDVQTYERFAVTTAAPLDGCYGSEHWQAGDRIALPMRLKVPHDLQPGTYQLGVIIYDMEREENLRLRDLPDVPDPEVRVGWFRLGSPIPSPGAAELKEQPVQVQWRNGIELTSVRLPSQPLVPGAVLPLQFTWQTSQHVSRDLTVFVHLADSQGEIVAQQDRPPFHGRWPTPVWQSGEMLQDLYEIALPDTLPAGEYELRVGFYDHMGRLMLADESGDYWHLPNAVKVVE